MAKRRAWPEPEQKHLSPLPYIMLIALAKDDLPDGGTEEYYCPLCEGMVQVIITPYQKRLVSRGSCNDCSLAWME